ncbi:MAG: carboxylating nicotinate-nucleotide diphosphorylase [Promethearchaeota archaeon]
MDTSKVPLIPRIPRFPYPIPKSIILTKIRHFLQEDIGFGDITSGLIPHPDSGTAIIKAKSEGIIAGLEEARLLCEDNQISIQLHKMDGDMVKKGDIVAELEGNLRNILMIERTMLNFLMKLSDIATSTHDLVQQVRSHGLSTIIAATRKTTPGFGYFEKKAVYQGGGDPHRWNLSDMVLLKDTHLKYYQGDITQLLEAAHKQISFSKKIELEIENPADLATAIAKGADIIMLDNMTPSQVEEALKTTEIPAHVLVEVSGNINNKNLLKYAQTGVNIISTSAIIFHPHKMVDFSLRLTDK